jgi:sterol desaturase/sphingolipid hydroxylase (fatty acid hydroxylase superfamily)
MIGFAVGMVAANAGEWFIHKHLLHGRGKQRASYWSFHFHEHHQASRKHAMVDADYERDPLGWHAQGKELLGLAAIGLVHAPLLPVAPGYTLAIWTTIGLYYRNHKKAHQDPGWARENLRWHYDHHMGPDQDANWCVTFPWFDHVMGTRIPYAGTEREQKDLDRAASRRKAA